jgi:hypothetical protein
MAASTPITTREDLQKYLQVAIKLEHATIPPYLTALYSIKADPELKNLDAYNIIRTVVVEEMLHLTLAANVLNAVGGAPDLNGTDFVPPYPTYLPTGQDDFEVGLVKFSKEAVDTFLNIERPLEPSVSPEVVVLAGISYVVLEQVLAGRASGRGLLPSFVTKDENEREIHLHFHSIGEFYKAIAKGINLLADELGEKELFNGNSVKQIGPEYYYSGGGKILKVTDRASANTAINLIADQGEGYDRGIFDPEGELAHFYRFDQLKQGRYYHKADTAHHPSGEELQVHWEEVYPIISNAKVEDYPEGSELRAAALDFNRQYKDFLNSINQALNGEPEKLIPAIGGMFKIKEAMKRLMHNPMPSGAGNAAPTFEMNQVTPLASKG